MKAKNLVFLLLLFVSAWCNILPACTTFVLKDGESLLFGRNLDSQASHGLLIANQRGISKSAFAAPWMEPARWVTRYGNVTFNMFGRELPCGGMNDAGLVVETMHLPESDYAEADDRAVISTGQWVQYQLDNCSTIEEVLATDQTIRIDSGPGEKLKPHYLVCDASGDTAAIEFLDGEMVCHRGDDFPFRALTNDTYKDCTAFLNTGDEEQGKKRYKSLNRFRKASKGVKEFKSVSVGDDLDYAFAILEKVSVGKFTKWNVVYDIPNRTIHYRTQDNERIRQLSLGDCDFAPGGPPVFVNVNALGEGEVTQQLSRLTEEAHKEYLLDFFGSESFKKLTGINGTPTMVDPYLKELRKYHPK